MRIKVLKCDKIKKTIDFSLIDGNIEGVEKSGEATRDETDSNNKKAYHDYFIEDTYEAGIALVGTEVKSLRMGKCSIKEAFVGLDGDEVYVYRMNISPYEKGNIFNKRSTSDKKAVATSL